MITSKKLTAERLKRLKDFPAVFNEGALKMTSERLARMKPAHLEYWKVEPIKVPLSIKIDADVLAWFKAGGKGYQTRMNAILREAMLHSQTG
ncbi:MAG: BrnA antitoxin family protein [Treponema sp.]|jgi:uncharacterized protein (DUF4415 family)|nr:BrnA antitoxin family protein [Treponema sp.]